MQRKCKICVSIFGSRRTTSHLALKLPSAVWTEPLKTPGCPIPRVTCAATDLCNLDSCVDKCHQVTVLLLSVISIFSNSPSAGDFQPVCIGITLFLQPVGGVESPVCREGDGSAGELARGAQLGCHQPRWMVSPKGAAGSDPPSCCSGTVLMDQTASWSCRLLWMLPGDAQRCLGGWSQLRRGDSDGAQVAAGTAGTPCPPQGLAQLSSCPCRCASGCAAFRGHGSACPCFQPGLCRAGGHGSDTCAIEATHSAGAGGWEFISSSFPAEQQAGDASPSSRDRQVMLLLHPGTG